AQTVEPVPEFDKKAQPPPGRAESDALVAAKPAPLPPPPAPSPASRVGNLPSAGKNESGLKSDADVDMALRAVSKTSLDVRIASPGGRTMWSVGAGGQIFHSTDAGRTWLPQISGVAADLTGGSAPSEKVCWVAGAAGMVLRTTDGGLHWQQILTPVAGDLGGIHALDAKRASIWDAPNRASYQTSDGGKTWKPSANE
ncbi:MAG TPA: YCF48-related protein, partial [Candidatus Acidoferrum sp.]|nr:YCF48-related protein [Candidatus Acidoferrum sp.]